MRDTLIRSTGIACLIAIVGSVHNVRAQGPTPASASSGHSKEVAQLLLSASLWHARYRNDLARDALGKVLLTQPDQPDALSLLGQIEIEENHPDQAARYLQTLRARYPNTAATRALADVVRVNTTEKQRLAKARLLSRSGQADAAWTEYKALFPDGPPTGSLGVEYYRAQANVANGLEPASAGLNRLTQQHPEDTRAAQALAELLIGRPSSRLAGTRMVADLAARPGANMQALLPLWQRALSLADGNAAWLPLYQRYLALAPNDADIRATYEKLNAQENARQRLLSDPAYQAQQRGIAALDAGRLKDAETALESARQKRPNDSELLGALGLVKMRQGEHREAAKWFEQALRLDPSNAGKWRSLLKTSRFWAAMADARDARDAGRLDEAERHVRAALAIDSGNADGLALLGDIAAADQRDGDAEQRFQEALKIDPNNDSALRGLVSLYARQHRRAELATLLSDLRKRFPKDAPRFDKAQSAALADEAETWFAEGRNGPALANLERAVTLDPTAPWTRYSLASVYRKLRLPEIGRQVMEEGFRQPLDADDNAQMHYAQAVYLNVIDDAAGARATLAQIPPAQLTPSMQQLQTTLAIRDVARQAREAAAAGDAEGSRRAFAQATSMAGDDPELVAEVARAMLASGDPDQGLALMHQWLDAHRDPPRPAAQLRYAELLSSAERNDALRTYLAEIEASKFNAEQHQEWQDLSDRLALRTADQARILGRFDEAHRALEPLLARTPPDRRAQAALADLYFDERRYAAARALSEQVLREDPQNQDVRLTLVRVLDALQEDDAANQQLARVMTEAPADDISTQLGAVRRLTAMQRYDEAVTLTDSLHERLPNHAPLMVQRGRIAQAQGQYVAAKGWYDEARGQEIAQGTLPDFDGLTSAQAAMESLEARRQSYVASAYEIDTKKGDGGISMFNTRALALYGQYAIGYDGHVFAQTDTVSADAGDLPLNGNSQYGVLPLLNATAFRQAVGIPAQATLDFGGRRITAHGQALMVGYRNDWLRADIGSTPMGFPVSYLTGGVRYYGTYGRYDYWIDASRRAMSGSMLSYAGAVVPLPTDLGLPEVKWGGVRRDAITFHGSRDFPYYSLFAEASVARLTGENVLNNSEISARGGVDLPLIYRPNMRLNTGITLFFDSFKENERFYTFGHGGYYSPQTYVSLTLPLEWYGRTSRWSYYTRASVSFSQSHEQAMPYFPTNATLQQLADNAQYGSGGGFSTGFSVLGRAEYWFDRRWVAGAQVQFERSDYYAPNRFLLYLRYHIDARRGEVPMPPSPVRPIWSY